MLNFETSRLGFIDTGTSIYIRLGLNFKGMFYANYLFSIPCSLECNVVCV